MLIDHSEMEIVLRKRPLKSKSSECITSNFKELIFSFIHYLGVQVFQRHLIVPHQLSMSQDERERWAPAFTKLGYDLEQVLAMPETEFINCRDYLEFEGFKPGPLAPINEEVIENMLLMKAKQKAEARRRGEIPRREDNRQQYQRQVFQQRQTRNITKAQEEAAELRAKQNEEYKEAIEQHKQRIEDKKNEAVELSSKIKEIQRKCDAIPKEPLENDPNNQGNVFTVAINLPNGTRLQRRFLADEKCSDIYDWAANQVLNLTSPPSPKEFGLRFPTGGDVNLDETLKEQGFSKKTLLNVFLLQQSTT